MMRHYRADVYTSPKPTPRPGAVAHDPPEGPQNPHRPKFPILLAEAARRVDVRLEHRVRPAAYLVALAKSIDQLLTINSRRAASEFQGPGIQPMQNWIERLRVLHATAVSPAEMLATWIYAEYFEDPSDPSARLRAQLLEEMSVEFLDPTTSAGQLINSVRALPTRCRDRENALNGLLTEPTTSAKFATVLRTHRVPADTVPMLPLWLELSASLPTTGGRVEPGAHGEGSAPGSAPGAAPGSAIRAATPEAKPKPRASRRSPVQFVDSTVELRHVAWRRLQAVDASTAGQPITREPLQPGLADSAETRDAPSDQRSDAGTAAGNAAEIHASRKMMLKVCAQWLLNRVPVVRQFEEADRSALVTAIAVHDAGAALASKEPVSSLAEFTLPIDAFLTPILEEAAELLAKPPSRRQPRKGETTTASSDEPNIADPTEPDATAHPAELPLLRSIHAIAATPASGTSESEASCRARVAELLSEVARTLGAFASSANAAASRSTQLRSAIELLGTAIKMGNDARAQGARGDDANDGIATGSNAVEWPPDADWFPLKEVMRIALDVTREVRPGMVLYAGGSAREEHRSLVLGLRQISGARGSVADIALRLALEGISDPRGADEIGRHPTPLTEEISRMSAEDFALLTRRDGATNFASEFGRQIIAHQILYHGDRIASLMPQLAPTVPDARPWLEVLEFAAEHRSTSRSIMELDLLRMSAQSLQRLPPTARSSYLLARVERLGTVARSWELDSPRQTDYVRAERVLDEHTLIAIKHAVDEFPFETIAAELPLPIIACVMSHAQFAQLALRDEEVIRLFRYMGPRAQVLWSHAWKRLAPEYRGTASRDTAAGSMSSSAPARDGQNETHTQRTISKDRLAEPIPAHEKAFLSVIAASAMNIGDLVRLANAKLGAPASDHIHNLAGVILQRDRIARALAIKIENAQDAELLVEVGGARVVSHLSEQQLLKLIFGCEKFSWPRKPRLEFFTQPEVKPALAAIARQVAEMKHPDPSPKDDDGDGDEDDDGDDGQPASAWSRKLSIPSFGAGDDDEDDDTDRGPAGAARLMLKVLAAPDSRSPRGLGGIDSKTIAKLVELAAKDHPGTSRKHARTAYAAAKQWKVDPADPATRNGSTAPDAIDNAVDIAVDIAVELGEAGLGDEFTHLVDIIEASSLDDRYKTHVIPKKRGGVREIHEPDEDLKRLQRKVLDRLLGGVPISPDAHGFVVDRGIVTNAEAHCGSEVVLNVDIRSFFPSLPAEQIRRALSESRYGRLSSAAIDTLFKIVTRCGRLPQGAPTSPAITNIALRHTDGMLAKACKKAGISYTRYADDLTFSGDSGPVQKIVPLVVELLARIGLELHPEKTQVYRHGRRQLVTGLVVNHSPNLPRRDRRTLRAAAHRSRRGLTMRWKGVRMSKESFEGRLAVLKMVDPDLAKRLKATADNEDIPPRKKATTSQKAATSKKTATSKKATGTKKATRSKKARGTKKALGTKKPRGKDSK